MNNPSGKVYLIGAGPGLADLLTARGSQCLARADVILYDYLASIQLRDVASDDAELICLGRHGAGKIWTQAEINKRMIDDANAGKTVARLKGGDPAVFGRLAEEVAALKAAGVDYEIVPGVSAATAAACYADIPLTNRDAASCVTFVTGQESGTKEGAELDYAALATTPGTLVFYMGVTTASRWSEQLINHGKSPDTPVAIVRRVSLPDQQTIPCKLSDIGERIASEHLRPPAIVIVGDVARGACTDNWFTRRPLFGQTVLVTRPAPQSHHMGRLFENLGARVIIQSSIEIRCTSNPESLDRAIARLNSFDWIVFSSVNGVDYFFQRLSERGGDARLLGGVKIAAIGPATVEALEMHRLSTDAWPDEYRAEALAEKLAPVANGARFLLIRASRGREVLAEMLTAAGGHVEQVVAYDSMDVDKPASDIAAAMAAGEIAWTTVTSSAIARNLVNLFGEDLRKTRLAAISPLTAGVLQELGHESATVAEEFTSAGLIDAIVAAATQD